MQRGSFPIMIFDGIGGSFETLIYTSGVCISKVCCRKCAHALRLNHSLNRVAPLIKKVYLARLPSLG